MNAVLTKPKFILELSIFNVDENSHIVKDYFGNVSQAEMVEAAQKTDCDFLGLKFNISDISQVEKAVSLLKTLLPIISKPLMIRGINNKGIDIVLIPELINALDREAIIAFADENTYKSIVPAVINGGHTLVIRTPIDINLAKEMNILTSDMGLPLDKIIIDTDMGGLGYGLEYGYSIMEKIKLAADSDKMLNMPMIAFVGEESLKTKEAKSDTFSKSWGDFKTRARMFEITTASAVLVAGAKYIVMNEPNNIAVMKKLEK